MGFTVEDMLIIARDKYKMELVARAKWLGKFDLLAVDGRRYDHYGEF